MCFGRRCSFRVGYKGREFWELGVRVLGTKAESLGLGTKVESAGLGPKVESFGTVNYCTDRPPGLYTCRIWHFSLAVCATPEIGPGLDTCHFWTVLSVNLNALPWCNCNAGLSQHEGAGCPGALNFILSRKLRFMFHVSINMLLSEKGEEGPGGMIMMMKGGGRTREKEGV